MNSLVKFCYEARRNFITRNDMKKILNNLCLVGATALLSHGASITVADPSFESNPAGDLSANATTWSNDLTPDWEERGGPGNGDAFEEFIGGFSADGSQHVGINVGGYIWQDTGVALQPNTTYTLSLAAGNRAGQSNVGNVTTYSILAGATNLGVATYATAADVVADNGLTLATQTVNATTLAAEGTFADAPSLVFTTGAVVPAENVVIFLGADGVGRSHFDNIRLDASPVPEPSTSLLGVLAGLALLRRRR